MPTDSYGETALLRALAAIHDGHINLYAQVRRFDPMTGERHPAPVIEVHPDRGPCVGTPNASGDWWLPLMERGWLRLVDCDRPHYRLTVEGERALAARN